MRCKKGVETLHVVAEDVASSTPRGRLIPRSKLVARLEVFFPRGVDPTSQRPVLLVMNRQPMEGSVNVRWRRGAPCHEGGEIGARWLGRLWKAASWRQGPGPRWTNCKTDSADPQPTRATPMEHQPHSHFDLDEKMFGRNLRSSRRGVAGGPSDMTCEHLRPSSTSCGQCISSFD